jgi:hypothetical protein
MERGGHGLTSGWRRRVVRPVTQRDHRTSERDNLHSLRFPLFFLAYTGSCCRSSQVPKNLTSLHIYKYIFSRKWEENPTSI